MTGFPSPPRFLSTFTCRFDGKGRVSVPAPFRAILEADGYPGVFAHPALEHPALECGGHRLLAEIDAMIARFPSHSEARDLIATALLGSAEILKLDPEGRIALPERFRTHLGPEPELVFVGLGDRFRMWSPAAYRAYLEGAKSRLRDLRTSLAGPENGSSHSGGSGGAGPLRGVRET